MKKTVKWRPKEDIDSYYYIDTLLRVATRLWTINEVVRGRFVVGNCFPTRKEAEAMAKKVRLLFKK